MTPRKHFLSMLSCNSPLVTGQLAPKKKGFCRPELTRPQVNSPQSNFISTLGGFYGASYMYISSAHEFYYLIMILSLSFVVLFSTDTRK